MKKLCLLLALSSLIGSAFAREVKVANSAIFTSDESGQQVLKVNYNTGGCNPKNNRPAIKLEHVSTVDVTPEWAIEEDPNTIHEYKVTFKAKVVELGNGGLCMMSYRLDVEGNINELFKEAAPSLGIDLPAKKAHYSVEVIAPDVKGWTSFTAF